jgi:hypothetical protein
LTSSQSQQYERIRTHQQLHWEQSAAELLEVFFGRC